MPTLFHQKGKLTIKTGNPKFWNLYKREKGQIYAIEATGSALIQAWFTTGSALIQALFNTC